MDTLYIINKVRRSILCLLLMLPMVSLWAENVLQAPTISIRRDHHATLPVKLDNSSQIVAVQFTLALPEGFCIYSDGSQGFAELTNRRQDHRVEYYEIDDSHVNVMVYSANNLPVRGNAGTLLNLQIYAQASVTEGESYPFQLTDVNLCALSGENVTDRYEAGNFVIGNSTDFAVSKVTISADRLNPGDALSASWTVQNVGGLPATGSWHEELYLCQAQGDYSRYLTTLYPEHTLLDVGQSMERSQEFAIPALPGIDGELRLKVVVVPNSDSGEMPETLNDNTAYSQQTLLLSKTLQADPARLTLTEGSNGVIYVTRSGNWNEALTLQVENSDADRLSLPATISFEANNSSAYLELSATDNLRAEGTQYATITLHGGGYDDAIIHVSIADAEPSAITLTASQTQLNEGDRFELMLTIPYSLPDDVAVQLLTDQPARIDLPDGIVIPAGQTEWVIPVGVTDDAEPAAAAEVTLTAWTEHFGKGSCEVEVLDDDMPVIELQLTPMAVSESAGECSALMGKLIRKSLFDNEVHVSLSDDSNDELNYVSPTLTFAPGAKELQFPIGIKSNSVVEGDREVVVTASVLLSSCSCNASAGSAGVSSRTLTIVDDDCPALNLKCSQSVLLEGRQEAGYLIVSRNDQGASPVTIRLSSDCDSDLSYSQTITMPAGITADTIPLTTLSNLTTDDDRMVTFVAEAEGYARSTCWAAISNQTLPDAAIGELKISSTDVVCRTSMDVAVSIRNEGLADLPDHLPIYVYLGDEDFPYTSATTDQMIPAGGSASFTVTFTLPAQTGEYPLWLSLNPLQSQQEILYTNNVSTRKTINVLPRFTASIQTDRQQYQQTDSVVISGQLEWLKEELRDLTTSLYLKISPDNKCAAVPVEADYQGRFTYVYHPHAGITGHFEVFAYAPGDAPTKESTPGAAFDMYGLTVPAPYTTCEATLGTELPVRLAVRNPGRLPLSQIQMQITGSPDYCEWKVEELSRLEAGQTDTLRATLLCTDVTPQHEWEKVPVRITSAEGAQLDYKLYVYARYPEPKLYCDSIDLRTTIPMGGSHEVPIKITNNGARETGQITLGLPRCVEAVQGITLPSLAPGQSTDLRLRFVTIEEMRLNVPVTGTIAINCANGDGLPIHYRVTPVSDQTGVVTIDATDEYSYYGKEKPHLADAEVTISAMSSDEVLAQGKTDHYGHFRVQLHEGYYRLKVIADKHYDYEGTVLVDPGQETTHETFLGCETVTYSWEVEETSVEEDYVITTTATLDVNVPAPLVTITLPKDRPEPGAIFPVVIENQGFIAAMNVSLNLSTDLDDDYNVLQGYDIELLNPAILDSLPAHSSYTVYAKLVKTGSMNAPTRMADDEEIIPELCFGLKAQSFYDYLCGLKKNERMASTRRFWGNCPKEKDRGDGGGSNNDSTGRPSSPNDDQKVLYPTTYISVETTEEICNCKKKPILRYAVVEPSGPQYVRKGLAADGVSQVKVVLDPRYSFLPPTKCGYKYKWSLVEPVGELVNTYAPDYAYYRAPADFPAESGLTYTVHAKMEYWNKDHQGSVTVPIQLIRVPVVFVHGLNDSSSCWQDMDKSLSDLYQDFQTYCVNYAATNCDHFRVNARKPQEGINHVLSACRAHKYIATKAVLVGHSMGGILSRLHVQEYPGGNKNVYKLITVNTPHSGSVLGDLFGYKWHLLDHVHLLFSNTDAIRDLAFDSPQIDSYLNDHNKMTKMRGIPVHAIVTESQIKSNNSALNGLLSFAKKMGYDLTEPGDLIVNHVSQQGGLSGMHSSVIHGPNHLESPKDARVMQKLRELLLASARDSRFALDGFHPEDLSFAESNYAKAPRRNTKTTDTATQIQINADGGNLHVKVSEMPTEGHRAVVVTFGNQGAFVTDEPEFDTTIPATFYGMAYVCVVSDAAGTPQDIANDSILISQPRAQLLQISAPTDSLNLVVGQTHDVWLNCLWDDQSTTVAAADSMVDPAGIVDYEAGLLIARTPGQSTITLHYGDQECRCVITVIDGEEEDIEGEVGEEGAAESTCSQVVLQFVQTATVARQAFRGTLTVNNGNVDASLRDFKLYLDVRNSQGEQVTKREFHIETEKVEGFASSNDSSLSMTSGWTLDPSGTGRVTILFIPTLYAAEHQPEEYSFGGTFSYFDEGANTTVTRTLTPVTLTVNPCPNLELTYFLQRDVYGDDALTPDIVEPSLPVEFALVINNKGAGDATSVKLSTEQPQITSNEKGLDIDVEFTSSQLNGEEATLALGGSMPSDFGVIPAHSTSYAQWWLQSSLLGHFTKYDVSVNYISSYDNPNLSLMDTATIHELIHGFTLPTDISTPVRGFLVNDIPDLHDCADRLYFSDGRDPVRVATTSTAWAITESNHLNVTISPNGRGWNYGYLSDPTNGRARLQSVKRVSDGTMLPSDNFWLTSVTLFDGKDPIHENLIHFIVDMTEATETYEISFEPLPDVTLEVESFRGIPLDNNGITDKPVKRVSVTFNKSIDASTFTSDDITLRCNAIPLDCDEIEITPGQEQNEYILHLNELTQYQGLYQLTIQTAGITDADGFAGAVGKTVMWSQTEGLKLKAVDNIELTLFPNPVKDYLFVGGDYFECEVSIIDMLGVCQIYEPAHLQGSGIDVSALKAGTYVAIVRTEDKTLTQLIIK